VATPRPDRSGADRRDGFLARACRAGVLFVLLVTLATLAARAHPLLELACHFRVHLALIALVLAVGLALSRNGRWLLVALLLAAFHLSFVARLWLGGEGSAVEGERKLRLLQLNVGRATKSWDAVARVVEDTNADVVVLIGVDREWMSHLTSLLERWPESASELRDDGYGLALLSRYPVEGSEVVDAEAVAPMLAVTLTVEGAPVRLVVVHPFAPDVALAPADRAADFASIARVVSQRQGPVVIAGELDTTPFAPSYRRLVGPSDLRDARRGIGPLGTWPARLPAPLRLPVDLVLTSPDVRTVDCRVGKPTGSDHLPFIVDLRVAPAGRPG
jgi:endonuclease/exonuclease/phosphatase (EEP) superfamily protein YafD